MSAITVQDITSRNGGLFNLATTKIGIIGAGAIGSFTAESLVRSGCMNITVIDGDSVGPENIGVQNYDIDDLGKSKTIALKEKLIRMNPTLIINACPFNWEPLQSEGRGLRSDHSQALVQLLNSDILIMAVDNMQTRIDIVKDLVHKRKDFNKNIYLIDSRMGAEVFQLYLFKDDWKYGDYKLTWYSDENSDQEPCNARSTSYCANMAAAFIVNQIKKIVQQEATENEITFSFNGMLLASKLDHNIELPEAPASNEEREGSPEDYEDTYPNGYYKAPEDEELPNFFIGD
tara:strand:+ start:18316 stop:19182 length:867 start_codon:yes stop_codon:yes gene_type:complete